MRKRAIPVLFRVNEEEYQHLKAQVSLSGHTTAQFLRQLIAGASIKPRPTGEMAEIKRQLAAIGNNVNQIARIANTYNRVRQSDVEYIIEMQTKIWLMMKRL